MDKGFCVENSFKPSSLHAKHDKAHQDRWDKIWDDPRCQQYKCSDRDDFWLWNHDFYNAEIENLKHIAKLIGAKEVK